MKVILIPGTWGWDDDSKYSRYEGVIEDLKAAGYEPLFFPWSTDLGGIGFGSNDLRNWKASAYALKDFAAIHLGPEDECIIITHSHGLQVVLYAAERGLVVHKLLDISGPFRRDLKKVSANARVNIYQWVHFHGDWWRDYMNGLGGWFDTWNPLKWFQNPRSHPLADENIHIKGAGHTSTITKAELFKEYVIPHLLK